MLIESFSQAILKWLRVPPGAALRKSNSSKGQSPVEDNDYVQAIIDITVDDICIGDSPLSVDFETNDLGVQKAVEAIVAEFNTVVKDVARDLCIDGVSAWEVNIKDNVFRLIPIVDSYEVFMKKDKSLVLLQDDKPVDCILFINYNKRCLSASEDEKYLFKVSPQPMQLRNADKTVEGIANAEKSIARYRGLLKPVRWANVDIGAAQGNTQQDVVDTISSAINADSESLNNSTTYTDFDDNIPVLPNRKGIGKVEIVTDIPSADIKELADLNYWLSKLNLVMRFPGTYMDFSKSLSESAVSTLRGDIRYLKLCTSVQSKITTTINKFLQESKFKAVKPVVSLIQLPSSEDDDVIQALGDYNDLASSVEQFVMEGEDKASCLHRLTLIKDLFDSVTTSPLLQKWFDDFESYIQETKHFLSSEEPSSAISSEDSDATADLSDLDTGSESVSEPLSEQENEEGSTENNDSDVEYLDAF